MEPHEDALEFFSRVVCFGADPDRPLLRNESPRRLESESVDVASMALPRSLEALFPPPPMFNYRLYYHSWTNIYKEIV